MKKPKPTFNWAELDAVTPALLTGQPADSFTPKEYAERYGISERGAQYKCLRLMRLGKLERIRFRTDEGNPSSAYRLKK